MKKKLFFLATILPLGLLTGCQENEYMLDDSSTVTPKIEIAAEDAHIQATNGATVQLKALVSNPSGLSTVVLSSAALGINEEITVNAPSYTLNKDVTVAANMQAGLYIVSVTANSSNLLTLTKEIKVSVTNQSDNVAPEIELLSDTEEQYRTTFVFNLKATDNLGLQSLKVWSDDIAFADSIELDGLQEFVYEYTINIPGGYSEKTVDMYAQATDLFGNITTMEPAVFKVDPLPQQLYLVGGSSIAGWDQTVATPFEKLEDEGKFRIYTYLVAADGGIKFLPELGSWNNDWGMAPGEPGKLQVEGEDNVTVPEDGFYAVNVDFTTLTYELVKMNFGIIGAFSGWGDTKLMNFNEVKGNYTFTLTQIFNDPGEFKFKWDRVDDWSYNFGAPTNAGELSGEAVFNGENIKIPEVGTYAIELNLDPEGYTYSVVKQ